MVESEAKLARKRHSEDVKKYFEKFGSPMHTEILFFIFHQFNGIVRHSHNLLDKIISLIAVMCFLWFSALVLGSGVLV